MNAPETQRVMLETSDALFAPGGLYRYTLSRTWDHDLAAVMFIGLNPSTADASADDPTIRRCKRFARDWGYGGLVMVNLFAFRSTDPALLRHLEVDPVGADNDRHLAEQAGRAGLVVAAWGAFKQASDRADEVVELLADVELHCLGLTAAGAPRHPLFVPAAVTPTRWTR